MNTPIPEMLLAKLLEEIVASAFKDARDFALQMVSEAREVGLLDLSDDQVVGVLLAAMARYVDLNLSHDCETAQYARSLLGIRKKEDDKKDDRHTMVSRILEAVDAGEISSEDVYRAMARMQDAEESEPADEPPYPPYVVRPPKGVN